MIDRIISILRDTLQLSDKSGKLDESSPLLGAIPEFDSMAVVSVLTMVEEEFEIVIEDDDVSTEIFETVGSLAEFVQTKVNE